MPKDVLDPPWTEATVDYLRFSERLHRQGQSAPVLITDIFRHDFLGAEVRVIAASCRGRSSVPSLQMHRGSSKEEQDIEIILDDPLCPSHRAPHLACLMGVLEAHIQPFAGDFMDFFGEASPCSWDPSHIPDGPLQRGRSPKAYHHQFQPSEGRRETAPDRQAREAARKRRKRKK